VKKRLVILNFIDEESTTSYLVDTEFDEGSLQRETSKIVNKFMSNGIWNYAMVLSELEKQGLIEVVDTVVYEIYF